MLKIFSTAFNCSLFAKKTTDHLFQKIKFDLGIITWFFLTTAPILISSGKFASLIFLFINSDFSKILASINSYSPSKRVNSSNSASMDVFHYS